MGRDANNRTRRFSTRQIAGIDADVKLNKFQMINLELTETEFKLIRLAVSAMLARGGEHLLPGDVPHLKTLIVKMLLGERMAQLKA